MRLLLWTLITVAAAAQSWQPQQSGTKVSLRGVSAVNAKVVWASGEKGTLLKTTDGGANWQVTTMPGAADLDFRGIRAISERQIYLLSSGPGEKSRIYKTSDGGGRWSLLFSNPEPKGFFDSIAFWDATHGIIVGDPVKGRFVVLTTIDGGGLWRPQKGPAAVNGEGAFAASNTCLFVRGTREVWFATGGPGGARVFHSTDGGETWTVSKTPIRNDSASAGIFSFALADGTHGVAVGGDYSKPGEATGNIALTSDGGKTWAAPTGQPPNGYRSAIQYLADRKMWIAVGTSGSDASLDEGNTWNPFDTAAYNAISFEPTGGGWAVGPQGAIARFKIE
jgi:photosystem II stability/assembly factor-like uncharacterized protein